MKLMPITIKFSLIPEDDKNEKLILQDNVFREFLSVKIGLRFLKKK